VAQALQHLEEGPSRAENSVHVSAGANHLLELVLSVEHDAVTERAVGVHALADESGQHSHVRGVEHVFVEELLRRNTHVIPRAAADVARELVEELVGGGVVEAVDLLEIHDFGLAVVDLRQQREQGPLGVHDGFPGEVKGQGQDGVGERLELVEQVHHGDISFVVPLHAQRVHQMQGKNTHATGIGIRPSGRELLEHVVEKLLGLIDGEQADGLREDVVQALTHVGPDVASNTTRTQAQSAIDTLRVQHTGVLRHPELVLLLGEHVVGHVHLLMLGVDVLEELLLLLLEKLVLLSEFLKGLNSFGGETLVLLLLLLSLEKLLLIEHGGHVGVHLLLLKRHLLLLRQAALGKLHVVQLLQERVAALREGAANGTHGDDLLDHVSIICLRWITN